MRAALLLQLSVSSVHDQDAFCDPYLTAVLAAQALAGALDFSGSSKPGLPTRLQSFSQEFAPKGTLPHQEIAR